jgi:signal transduction histidine kinase
MEDKAFNTYLKQKNKEIAVMERRAKELIRQTKYSKFVDREVEKEIRQLYERIQKGCEDLTLETLARVNKASPD